MTTAIMTQWQQYLHKIGLLNVLSWKKEGAHEDPHFPGHVLSINGGQRKRIFFFNDVATGKLYIHTYIYILIHTYICIYRYIPSKM